MAVIFTRAHVPDELANEWLQHLRNFDTKHPGCHFEAMIDPTDRTALRDVVEEMLEVDPPLTFQQYLERKKN